LSLIFLCSNSFPTLQSKHRSDCVILKKFPVLG
jgi:hypothetical protein